MHDVYRDTWDFLYISQTANDLKERTKEEQKKTSDPEQKVKTISFGTFLDHEIRSLA